MRVLIVDDDAVPATVLRRLVELAGHTPVVCNTGAAAQTQLVAESWDCLICDRGLPDLDGLELLRQARTADSYIYVIISSSLGELADREAGMAAGADDYLVKPIHPEQLAERLRVADRIVGLQRALQRERDALTQARAELQRDLAAAARVQEELLPPPGFTMPGLDLAWWLQPCQDLGGDLISLMQLPDGRLAFAVVDISGHGIKAALLGVQVTRHLALLGRGGMTITDDPPAVIMELNRAYQMDHRTLQYFTMLYGVLDPRDGTCVFSCAGHPGPLLRRANGNVEMLRSQGTPIGVLAPEQAVIGVDMCTLEPGDLLLCLSDGVTEAFDPQRQQFGVAQLERCLAEAPLGSQGAIGHITTALKRWRSGQEPHDDCTLLAIGRHAGP